MMSIEDPEIAKHRPRRGGDKPFTIEWRKPTGAISTLNFEWSVWKRYKKEADRDRAFNDIELKRGGMASRLAGFGLGYEFRKGPS
jgi:hypothetical protein